MLLNKTFNLLYVCSFKRPLKEFMPDEGDRYMMICSPALCLCQTVISTLGNQNMTSILQVNKIIN